MQQLNLGQLVESLKNHKTASTFSSGKVRGLSYINIYTLALPLELQNFENVTLVSLTFSLCVSERKRLFLHETVSTMKQNE